MDDEHADCRIARGDVSINRRLIVSERIQFQVQIAKACARCLLSCTEVVPRNPISNEER
jgi:hypothetical protein